jgi:hypothetical protein
MAATETVSPSDGTQSKVVPRGDVEYAAVKQNRTASFRSYLMADVDPAQTTAPLAAYCFMTGFM